MARQYFAAWLAAMVQVWAGVVPAAEPAASGNDAAADLSMFEATVTASRRREVVIESPRAVSVLHRDEMDRRLTRTTPEALIEEPGVFVQRTNYGGGAPFVRGQFGNRILLLVDGIRLNNSTFRAGPNQYLNTVDRCSPSASRWCAGPARPCTART